MLLCIYMHRLQWSLIAKKSECLVDPISMLLSQLLSQLRPQLSSSSYMFEDIKMGITSSRKPGRMLDRENTWFCRHGRALDREILGFVGPDGSNTLSTRAAFCRQEPCCVDKNNPAGCPSCGLSTGARAMSTGGRFCRQAHWFIDRSNPGDHPGRWSGLKGLCGRLGGLSGRPGSLGNLSGPVRHGHKTVFCRQKQCRQKEGFADRRIVLSTRAFDRRICLSTRAILETIPAAGAV